jgi:hypothetical protein
MSERRWLAHMGRSLAGLALLASASAACSDGAAPTAPSAAGQGSPKSIATAWEARAIDAASRSSAGPR